jgi:hypothetical protein
MSLLDQIRLDIEQITANNQEFAVSATFTSPDGETATINVIHSKHHLGIDTDGNRVNSKNAHISFAENNLTAEGYTVRNAADEVSMINHRVTVADSTGIQKEYVIKEAYPDEMVGLIVCILNDFE